ncbi:AAA family ATPase [Kribbella sp. NPDC051936]|uniref:AAA family ATPase n=1 Tax=Kribbella sp. NPDC051936 TaxID=3154946 RepID=UPI00342B5B62
MLIRFEVSNFRSIRESVELSMVAVDAARDEAQRIENVGLSLLHVTAIYGPNASGKSNIVAAMAWLCDAVRTSLRSWDDSIPIEPFAFGDWRHRPSEFTIESVIDGIRFEYVLELSQEGVSYEGLFHYPEKKRRRIFERDTTELKLQRGLGNLSGTRELLTGRTLALSIARRFDEPLVSDFATDLLQVQTLGLRDPAGRPQLLRHPTISLFEETEPVLFELDTGFTLADRAQALALLRMADLGIDDVLVVDDPRSRRPGRQAQLTHRSAQGSVPLDFQAESAGTRTWFRLIGPVLAALKEGSLLLFDELDASLHPTLSQQLIGLFQDPLTNPRHAQLIFTTHDTSLLNQLNRDEVWLTEKSGDGATRLGALAEFAGERVRTSVNLEKAYLHGRFGALPDTDRTELLRALGLIA